MSMQDTLADMFTRIRNGQMAGNHHWYSACVTPKRFTPGYLPAKTRPWSSKRPCVSPSSASSLE